MPLTPVLPQLSAVILAGGQGQRMGGQDKGLLELNGQPLIAHVQSQLPAQVSDLIISCNRNQARYQRYGRPVSDAADQHNQGPLAGLIAALPQAMHEWIVVAPCDLPHYPTGFADCAWQHLHSHPAPLHLAVAHDGQRQHNLCLLLHRAEIEFLQHYYKAGGRSVHPWLSQRKARTVCWPSPSAFTNCNTLNTLNPSPSSGSSSSY